MKSNNYFKRDNEANRFRDAVRVEIDEFGQIISAVYIGIQMSNPRATKEDIEICRRVLEIYGVPNAETYINTVKDLLSLPEDQFQVVGKQLAEKRRDKAHNLPSLKLAYLSSTPTLIGLLDASEQKLLIQMISLIERANFQITDIRHWVKEMTKEGYPKNAETNYNLSIDALMITLKRAFDLIEAIKTDLKSP